jgi:hypothetical protein
MPSLLEQVKDMLHQRAQEMDGLHDAAADHAAKHVGEDRSLHPFADRLKAMSATMWDEVRQLEDMLGMSRDASAPAPSPAPAPAQPAAVKPPEAPKPVPPAEAPKPPADAPKQG